LFVILRPDLVGERVLLVGALVVAYMMGMGNFVDSEARRHSDERIATILDSIDERLARLVELGEVEREDDENADEDSHSIAA